jgi:hypothetical protein
MSNQPSINSTSPDAEKELVNRRLFLQSLGKWSGAAIAAVVVGSTWFGSAPETEAGAWVNRRGGYGGAWVNRRGYAGGGWINGYHGGAGGWVNRRYYGGGGSWINRW